jgi:2-amino-4-hydroxy-6-hydroxymethyldihydropteridine diphosphokinase
MLCYIGLGSNLGNSLTILRWAVSRLEEEFGLIGSSLIYQSKAMYDQNQDDFLNMVCSIHTDRFPHDILKILQKLETESGRVRDPFRPKGPRCLDLDLLYCGGINIETKDLVIPHPSMAERLFVIRPLLDLDPDFQDPRSGKPFSELVDELADQGVYFFGSLE